jgi:low affinity Fe/Cu permease
MKAELSPDDDVPRRPNALERLAVFATRAAGSSGAFALALGAVLLWLVTGPIFGWSDTWQLVINTATTIVTFLMVFLIQRTQNKDSQALHLKLNEIVAALNGASNRLIAVERLSEADLDALRRHFEELAELAARESSITKTHSVEEARRRHEAKGPRAR